VFHGRAARDRADLKRAPQRKEFTVTFFGGEPLLNFRLVRAWPSTAISSRK
jgi:sulfatase maturation enzyme AslB (radical SAM superfamily)